MEGMLLFFALTVALHAGFVLLALSQDRNWRLVVAAPPPSRVLKLAIRTAGYVLLAAALPIALWRDGPSFGSLLWGTMVSVAGCVVTLTLSWLPDWLGTPAHRISSADDIRR